MLSRRESVDKMARAIHEEWASWARRVVALSRRNEDGSATVPRSVMDRFRRQATVPFDTLTEGERTGFLDAARLMLERST